MSSEATGYTAAQYLEAGYRAESHGERERAQQYYAYVAEAFPETPEGEAARGGLMRLGLAGSADVSAQGQAPVAQQQPTGTPVQSGHAQPAAAWPQHEGQHAHRAGNGVPHHPGAGQAPSWQAPPEQRTGGQRARPQPSQQPAPQAGQRIALGELARLKMPPGQPGEPHHHGQSGQQGYGHHRQTDAGHGLAAESQERLPEVVARRQRELAAAEEYEPPARRFRSGRLMAWLFVVVGWLSIAGGIAAIALGFVFSSMGGSVMGVGMGTIAGVGAIASGLMMVMLGQLALAVFENTDAVREIATLVRLRGDF